MSLGQQATPTPLQVLYEANIYFCFVQTPLYEVLKIIKCSEIICDAKMTVGGNHVVFCPGYNSVLQARNCALELRLLGHFISRLFWCWRDTHCSLWTWGVILPTQAANRFPPPPPFSCFLLPKRNLFGSWVWKVYFGFACLFVCLQSRIESRWE